MNSRSLGLNAEEEALRFLRRQGYKHLTSNFRSRFGEIDLIMLDRKQLVFVEVKARSSTSHGTPSEFITHSKLSKLIKTSQFFLAQNRMYSDYRFDAVEVYLEDPIRINHIKNITL